MTTPTSVRRPVRRSLTGGALLVSLLVVALVAAPAAQAAPPEGWSNPDPVAPLHALIVFVFAPIGLAAVTVLGATLPSLVGRQRGSAPLASEERGLDLITDQEE